MKMKFNWNTSVPGGVKGLKRGKSRNPVIEVLIVITTLGQ